VNCALISRIEVEPERKEMMVYLFDGSQVFVSHAEDYDAISSGINRW
jgi:hypothetical protein